MDDSLLIISLALAVTLFKALIKTSLHSSAYSKLLQEEELSRAQPCPPGRKSGDSHPGPGSCLGGEEVGGHRAEPSTGLSETQRHP